MTTEAALPAKTGGAAFRVLLEKYGEYLLCVCFRHDEKSRRQRSAGGKWNPGKQLWFVKYGRIAGTPLEKHISVDASG